MDTEYRKEMDDHETGTCYQGIQVLYPPRQIRVVVNDAGVRRIWIANRFTGEKSRKKGRLIKQAWSNLQEASCSFGRVATIAGIERQDMPHAKF